MDYDIILSEHRRQTAEARESFGRWLSSVFGQAPQVALGTYTFRDRLTRSGRTHSTPGRQYVTRAGLSLVSLLMENGSTFFVCVEEGSDTRRLHLHSLETSGTVSKLRQVHRWWREKYGYQRSSVVSSREGVSLYVTKYVTKSDMPFWAAGPLFRSSTASVGLDKLDKLV